MSRCAKSEPEAGTAETPRPPKILAIDAAGLSCSVAVAVGDEVLAVHSAAMAHGQAEALLPMVDRAMGDAGLETSALDLVAATIGPGSFTGIRVGLAAARGIALGGGLPLFGVTGFAAFAALWAPDGRLLLTVLESRRTDLYLQFFDRDRRPLGEAASVLPTALAETARALVGDEPLAIAGDAAERAMLALAGRPHTGLCAPSAPAALGAARVARARWDRGARGDSTRPFYLRPPDVSPPRRQPPGESR